MFESFKKGFGCFFTVLLFICGVVVAWLIFSFGIGFLIGLFEIFSGQVILEC